MADILQRCLYGAGGGHVMAVRFSLSSPQEVEFHLERTTNMFFIKTVPDL